MKTLGNDVGVAPVRGRGMGIVLDNGVETLADPVFQEHCHSRFSDMAFCLFGGVLFFRTVPCQVEGRLAKGYEGMDVGRRLRVQLIGTDVERGFIDFKRVQ
jgi:hypothetical protein